MVPKQWIEENFLNRYSLASTMARDLNMDTHRISYLGAPEQNHHAATKGYPDTKLSLLGGDMRGEIGMAGNRISHLGEPQHDNDALRLSFANDYYLRRDVVNWMRNDLSVGGFRVRDMANPQTDQDGVNLRTLQASATSVLEQASGNRHSSRRRDNKPRKHLESRYQNKTFELGSTSNSTKKF